MTTQRVKCECCSGSGLRPLTTKEADTIAAVTADWEDTSAILTRLFRGRRSKLTTLLMRLTTMHAIGLVERRHRPDSRRVRQWRLPPAPDARCVAHEAGRHVCATHDADGEEVDGVAYCPVTGRFIEAAP